MNMRELPFGVEIEVRGLSKREIAERVYIVIGGVLYAENYPVCVVGPDGREWKIVNDGSIGGALSGELVTPILTYDDLPALGRIIHKIKEAGGDVSPLYVEEENDWYTCGIHVHIDASQFSARALCNLINLIYSYEGFLLRSLAVSDYRQKEYCKPIHPGLAPTIKKENVKSVDDLRRVWYEVHDDYDSGEKYAPSRYHGLNLHSVFYRGTIELRYFEGSLDAGQVISYIHLALALAAFALHKRTVQAKVKELVDSCAKFDVRVFLVHLGLKGDEFKSTRKYLTQALTGSNRRAIGRTC